MTPKLTGKGIDMIIHALVGESAITFSKIVLGNGDVPENYKQLTNLQNPIAMIGLDKVETTGSYALLTGTLRNSALESGFCWTEVGIYCIDPDGGDDILYAYSHYQLQDSEDGEVKSATYIPRFGSDVVELTLNYYVYVGEVEDVTAILAESSEYATKAALKQHLEDNQNPHHVDSDQVGLGNVPNVTTNDQTPTYTVPSALANLASGEKLSIAFGKIAAAVKGLISHLSDKIVHVTAAERNAWNGKANAGHNHSTTDITKGTLGLARGGTGGTTAETAMHSLLGIYAGSVGSSYRITSGKNLNSYTTGGTYWCVNADTAKTLTNCPYKNSNFLLLVFSPTTSQHFQIIMPNRSDSNTALYIRSCNTDKWGTWRKTTTTEA